MRGGDYRLYHRWQVAPNSGWSGWGSLGGVLPGAPTVASAADGHLEVFHRGTDSRLYHRWQEAPNIWWTPEWVSAGGALSGDPAVGRNHNGSQEVFVRWTDGTLRSAFQIH